VILLFCAITLHTARLPHTRPTPRLHTHGWIPFAIFHTRVWLRLRLRCILHARAHGFSLTCARRSPLRGTLHARHTARTAHRYTHLRLLRAAAWRRVLDVCCIDERARGKTRALDCGPLVWISGSSPPWIWISSDIHRYRLISSIVIGSFPFQVLRSSIVVRMLSVGAMVACGC